MSEALSPYEIINKKAKKIIIVPTITKLYNDYKKLLEENNLEGTEFDVFVAGYFLGGNKQLRDKYRDYFKFDDKVDNRFCK